VRKLYDAQAVADRLSVRLHRVYQLAREGAIPVVRIGRTMRFEPDAVERWIAQGGTGEKVPDRCREASP